MFWPRDRSHRALLLSPPISFLPPENVDWSGIFKYPLWRFSWASLFSRHGLFFQHRARAVRWYSHTPFSFNVQCDFTALPFLRSESTIYLARRHCFARRYHSNGANNI